MRNISGLLTGLCLGFEALLLLASGSRIAYADEEVSRISNDKPTEIATAPLISIPLQSGQNPPFYELTLDPNTEPAVIKECKKIQPTQKKFRNVQVSAGESLHINSYIVSNNLLDSQLGFQKGPDSPTVSQIRAAFDGKDTEAFLKILTKLAEERRSAETAAEMMAVKALNNLDSHPCTQIFVGTGFFEVSGKHLNAGDKDIRYFVRADDILGGQAKINLKNAKIEVLHGLSVFLFKKIDGDYQSIGDSPQQKLRMSLAQIFSEMTSQCLPSTCAVTEATQIGATILDMIAIHRAEPETLLDPKIENRLNLRKEMCVLRKSLGSCGPSPALQKVNALVTAEKIDCDKPQTLLRLLK